jgi:hypothetical protein
LIILVLYNHLYLVIETLLLNKIKVKLIVLIKINLHLKNINYMMRSLLHGIKKDSLNALEIVIMIDGIIKELVK